MFTTLIILGTVFTIANFILDRHQDQETIWQDFLTVWDNAEGEGRTSTADYPNPCK